MNFLAFTKMKMYNMISLQESALEQ